MIKRTASIKSAMGLSKIDFKQFEIPEPPAKDPKTFVEWLLDAGLDGNSITELSEWTMNRSLTFGINRDEIKKMVMQHVGEAIKQDLHTILGQELFLEYIKAAVTTDISNYTKPPVNPVNSEMITLMEFMPIGMYPRRMMKARDNTMIPMCEVVGWGRLADGSRKDGKAEFVSMMSVGNEEVFKLETMKPFYIYDTLVEINNKYKQKSGLIRCNSFKSTLFENNTINPSWIPTPIRDRQKLIVGMFVANTSPIIPLNEVHLNLSRLITGTNGQPFVDPHDFRMVQVAINKVNIGVSQSGLTWASLQVVDSTFMGKNFNIWCDAGLLKSVGVGNGSYVQVMGTLGMNRVKDAVEMRACAIIPIVIHQVV